MTTLNVHYDAGPGNQLFVRGQAPFSWEKGTPLQCLEPDLWQLQLPLAHRTRLKVLLNDQDWSRGENYLLRSGGETSLYPFFNRAPGFWREHPETFSFWDSQVRVWMYFPASYNENEAKRYSVLYCQDGQTLFSDTIARQFSLARGEWGLDEALDGLIQNGLMEEIMVVAVEARDSGSQRMFDYTPWYDSDEDNGGGAGHYLAFLLGDIKPRIDEVYRTQPDKNGIMGSSLGGLFAFYAGRTAPHVFQRVACLSSSFWWAFERTLDEVRLSDAHDPQKIYLDAGLGATERSAADQLFRVEKALVDDGYRLGVDLLTRIFRRGEHNELSWGSRVDVPLQFLYPWQGDGAL